MVFAQGAWSDVFDERYKTFRDILKVLSWIWIVPASVAGKLMTNDIIYGEFFGFTLYLWKIWKYMRTFAYFALGIIFIGSILRAFLIPNSDSSNLGKITMRTVLAWVLIQMSWWIFAVLIDFSTIAILTVSALPMQIMQEQRNGMRYTINTQKVRVVEGLDLKNYVNAEVDDNQQALELEDIMPKADTVAWPLVFFGAGVLNLMDTKYVWAPDTVKEWGQLATGELIKILIIFMLVIPFIVLMVVNAIRVFWIWVWIMISPLLILDLVFDGPLWKDKEQLKIWPILWLIFQPAAVIWLLSVWMILIIGILDILQWWEEFSEDRLETLQIEVQWPNSAKIWGAWTSEITIFGNLFNDVWGAVWWFIGQMILVMFTIFLLWTLVKAWFEFSKITSKVSTGMFKFAESMAWNIKIPGLWVWTTGLKRASRQATNMRWLRSRAEQESNTNLERIEEMLWMNEKGVITRDRVTALNNSLVTNGNGDKNDGEVKTNRFWSMMKGYRKYGDISSTSARFKETAKAWLQSPGVAKSLQDRWIVTASDIENGLTLSTTGVAKYIDDMMNNGYDASRVKRWRTASSSTSTWKQEK